MAMSHSHDGRHAYRVPLAHTIVFAASAATFVAAALIAVSGFLWVMADVPLAVPYGT